MYLVLFEFRFAKEHKAGAVIENETSESNAHRTKLVQYRFVKFFHRYLLSVPVWHKIIV